MGSLFCANGTRFDKTEIIEYISFMDLIHCTHFWSVNVAKSQSDQLRLCLHPLHEISAKFDNKFIMHMKNLIYVLM